MDPKPRLKPNTLYEAYDRLVCDNPRCCGMTALFTGMSIDGHKLRVFGPAQVRQSIAAYPDIPCVCECGAINLYTPPTGGAL